ncbi:MAG: hypothetical protein EOL93_01705 [Epsilonproteobacteria bacterium]|nr:hypothetical protein [Campylobacterota bacterium]
MEIEFTIPPVGNLASKEEWLRLIGNEYNFSSDQISASFRIREEYTKVSFPILTNETIWLLSHFLHDKHCVDLGCGTGYLAANLVHNGVYCDAVDDKSNNYGFAQEYIKINKMPMLDVDLSVYDAIILSWPCYQSNMAECIARIIQPGQYLIYLGEGYGGCCADDGFFEYIDNQYEYEVVRDITDNLNDWHTTFNGIHDWWRVLKKI